MSKGSGRSGRSRNVAHKIVLTYLDGRVEDVRPSPRARIETERHFGGLNAQNVQEATFYLAWTHLSKSGKVTDLFDTWLDSLADVDEVEIKEPRPTQQAQSSDISSD